MILNGRAYDLAHMAVVLLFLMPLAMSLRGLVDGRTTRRRRMERARREARRLGRALPEAYGVDGVTA